MFNCDQFMSNNSLIKTEGHSVDLLQYVMGLSLGYVLNDKAATTH